MVTVGGAEFTPTPERARVAGELDALLTKDKLPDTLAAAVGVKATMKLELCPGLRVNGKASPLTEKPLPVRLSCETVKLVVLEFLNATVCVSVVPIATFPKLTFVGTTEI
jgi:hypothetical protein